MCVCLVVLTHAARTKTFVGKIRFFSVRQKPKQTRSQYTCSINFGESRQSIFLVLLLFTESKTLSFLLIGTSSFSQWQSNQAVRCDCTKNTAASNVTVEHCWPGWRSLRASFQFAFVFCRACLLVCVFFTSLAFPTWQVCVRDQLEASNTITFPPLTDTHSWPETHTVLSQSCGVQLPVFTLRGGREKKCEYQLTVWMETLHAQNYFSAAWLHPSFT